MKTNIIVFTGLALILGLGGGYIISNSSKAAKTEEASMAPEGFGNGMGPRDGTRPTTPPGDRQQPNRGNCLADECLLVDDLNYPAEELPNEVQEALVKALDDEYKALATYEAVIDKFGATRPFSMIIGAEEQHIAALKAVFTKYGVEIPENTWVPYVTAPTTIEEACQTGVDAEIANAALYKDTLLPAVQDYEDITAVFTNLMNASQQKHLPAFEKCN